MVLRKICFLLILLLIIPFIVACSSKQNIPNGNCTIKKVDAFGDTSGGFMKICDYDTYNEYELTHYHQNGAAYIVVSARVNEGEDIFAYKSIIHYDEKGNITYEENDTNVPIMQF